MLELHFGAFDTAHRNIEKSPLVTSAQQPTN
jgi:hypothetical protein